MIWVLAMVPVVCLASLSGIGWLTGGMALLVALACPQAMATIGVMIGAGVVVAMISIMMEKQSARYSSRMTGRNKRKCNHAVDYHIYAGY